MSMRNADLISELDAQFTYFLKAIPDTNEVPRSYSEVGGLMFASPQYWTCGFPPGSMWHMYELTGDEKWKEEAKARKEYEKKWRYKYCFKYWNKLVRFKFRILSKVFNWVHKISGNLWKLERKITF